MLAKWRIINKLVILDRNNVQEQKTIKKWQMLTFLIFLLTVELICLWWLVRIKGTLRPGTSQHSRLPNLEQHQPELTRPFSHSQLVIWRSPCPLVLRHHRTTWTHCRRLHRQHSLRSLSKITWSLFFIKK